MMQSGVVTFSWVHTAVQHTEYGRKVFRFQFLLPARAQFYSWKTQKSHTVLMIQLPYSREH